LLEKLRSRARALKKEVFAVYFAARDPRTPWYAKALVLLIVAYSLSPIDLIPDFIPILGYLDDLIIVPAGIALAIRLIPAQVMVEAREQAANSSVARSVGYVGLGIILLVWIILLIGVLRLIYFWLR
jgi:uncharacterized membrane protein YkvA (DUF1232 family)